MGKVSTGILAGNKKEIPNTDTKAAMKEAEEMKAHPEKYKRYSTFSELLKEVESDA